MTTPRGAPELVASQAVPETTVNEQIRRTEAGASRYPVADRVTAPPGTCSDGANYIIIATATGAFTGKENQIATAVGANAASGWYYRSLGTIDEGAVAYVQDEDTEYKWSGSAWATYGGAGYSPGGTDVALADGGTGALTDPNADRILFWDDSAGAVTWLTAGTGLTITGTTIDAAAGGGTLDSLSDVVITSGAQGDILYHNGTNFVNLAAGTSGYFLKTQGAGANPTWAAASGSGNAWNLQWGPLDNEPPTSNYATLDTRNGHPVLDFDTTTSESAVFSGVLPADYSGAGITVHIWCALTSATSGTVGWLVSIERIDASSLDIDADSFATANTLTAATVPGTSGQVLKMSLNISSGANMDSLAAGEMFRIKIARDVTNDTATGDAELLRVMMVSQ